MPTIADLVAFLEAVAPVRLAASWDNVGLLLGAREDPCRRVMTCLTVTAESAREAIDRQASLIVTHHPVLFRPVQRLTTARADGAMLWQLARAGVAVYSPHTAFDNARDGINASLAARLGLIDVRPLRSALAPAQCKLVVFVPAQDLDAVAQALFEAGAGNIGQYRECSFRSEGAGTFFGSESTNPAVGQKGRHEEVREIRLEAICPQHLVAEAVEAMRKAHSYEEPAYDVYDLRPQAGSEGEGRFGRLAQPLALSEFAALVKTKTPARLVQFCGEAGRMVERVALACGAAGEFLEDSVRAGADVFLTGEARFHDCLRARAEGIGLVLAGHYATERFAIEELAKRLQIEFKDVEIWASEREEDPLRTSSPALGKGG
jgi:dinuclear metal center YbgI/SA1388 family protein